MAAQSSMDKHVSTGAVKKAIARQPVARASSSSTTKTTPNPTTTARKVAAVVVNTKVTGPKAAPKSAPKSAPKRGPQTQPKNTSSFARKAVLKPAKVRTAFEEVTSKAKMLPVRAVAKLSCCVADIAL